MKTIGLIGGMSWESTVSYYQIINKKLGGLHSAKILLSSVDFAEIEKCQATGNWIKSAEILGTLAKKLECSGADFILICTNTMHRVATEVQKMITIPIVHIADPTILELHKQSIHTVALLGTRYILDESFYKQRILDAGFDLLIPEEEDIQLINNIIFNELCKGILSENSKKEYLRILSYLQKQGAEGVILGCTEIGLLIQQEDSGIPLFDTAKLHATYVALHSLDD